MYAFMFSLKSSFRMIDMNCSVEMAHRTKLISLDHWFAINHPFQTLLIPPQDLKNWEPKRVGVLVLYVFVMMFSCQRMYIAIRAPYLDRERRELTEAYMEALIPEPSPINIRRYMHFLLC